MRRDGSNFGDGRDSCYRHLSTMPQKRPPTASQRRTSARIRDFEAAWPLPKGYRRPGSQKK